MLTNVCLNFGQAILGRENVLACLQRLSIAAGGDFYNVPPQTTAQCCFKS
jgi:hypothetical protein